MSSVCRIGLPSDGRNRPAVSELGTLRPQHIFTEKGKNPKSRTASLNNFTVDGIPARCTQEIKRTGQTWSHNMSLQTILRRAASLLIRVILFATNVRLSSSSIVNEEVRPTLVVPVRQSAHNLFTDSVIVWPGLTSTRSHPPGEVSRVGG